jgi:hypothetical protein
MASTTSGAKGKLADAGVALGPGLEAAAEPAGLIAGVDDLEHGQGPVEEDAAAAQPGQLPEPPAGAEQAQHVVPPEQRDLGQQPTGLLRGEGPALGTIQDLFGIGAASGRGHLADGIGIDGAFVHGELQDPQHQRPALHEGGLAGAAGEVGLPTAEVGRADPADRLVTEPGSHIQPQAAFGHGQGGGTAVRVGGPHLPPLFGPPAEGKLAALEPLPGARAA